MLKYPLLPEAVCYAGGVLLGAGAPPVLLAGFAAGFGALVAFAFWPRGRPWALAVLAGAAGFLNLQVRTAVLAPHDLRRVAGAEPVLVTARGVLASAPELRVTGWGPEDTARSVAVLHVQALERDGRWEPASGRVAVTTRGELGPEFFAGRVVEVFGVLRPPRPPRAPGLFDARRYFYGQGLDRVLEARDAGDWRLAAGPQPARPPLPDRFRAWAQRTLARHLPVEDEPVRLLWAMTLGWRTALTDEVTEPFMRSGTMHLFAISGLHIALVAGVLVSLLRVARVPRGATGLAAVPLLWFYAAATGWQPSAVRATVMMSVVILGWALHRPGQLLNSLAAAALLILVWEPRQLFQAGFQLSFTVVLSLALVLPPLVRVRDRWWRHDPLLPAELLPRWRRWLDPVVRGVTFSLAVSLAAWLGSLPLIAHYFHLLTPVSLPANLLVVPLGSLALMSAVGALACGDWLPVLTGLFSHGAWFWMSSMIRVSAWAAGLPHAFFYVPDPGWPAMAVYYAALIGLASGWAWRPGRRALSAVLAGVLVLGGWGVYARQRHETRLTVLPLNGGPAVWVDAPGRARDLLVDAGNTRNAESVVVPFLRAQGVNRLAHLALTHGDVRHVGGAELIVSNFHPAAVWTGPARFRSPAYRAFLDQLAVTPERRRTVARGEALAGWTVLHPAATDRFARADDAALVLRAEIAGWRMLLLSDLGRLGQEALVARAPDLRADIVLAGLPRAEEPLEPALLEAIRPRVVIVADDATPTSARAGPALRARLTRAECAVLFTSDTGALTLRLAPGRWRVEDVDGRPLQSGQLPH